MVGNDVQVRMLRRRGWYRSESGWRNKKLKHPWTFAEAFRLECERNEGDPSAVEILGPAPRKRDRKKG